ncbi:MAG TPA: hypothetical protein PLS51_05400 [Flavobacterium sp.]|jgi:hypothetical protein|nr:hypothetical protein [Flavobacterium sp.]HPJ10045.1 hypothetical protein [Flavobacterium sp.]
MKFLLSGISLLCCLFVTAQRPCEFSANVTDSIGSYKSTKEYMVFEKNFAGKSTYVFNSFVVTDGMPLLNVQFLEKSDGFIKAKCLDKNSKLYIQLNNGKIVTLLHIDKSDCGNLIRDDKGMNNRILSGYFMFRKEDFQELKKSPVSFIRVKFGAETEDFIYRKAIKSEMNGELYEPESYFINYFHCLEDKN